MTCATAVADGPRGAVCSTGIAGSVGGADGRIGVTMSPARCRTGATVSTTGCTTGVSVSTAGRTIGVIVFVTVVVTGAAAFVIGFAACVTGLATWATGAGSASTTSSACARLPSCSDQRSASMRPAAATRSNRMITAGRTLTTPPNPHVRSIRVPTHPTNQRYPRHAVK